MYCGLHNQYMKQNYAARIASILECNQISLEVPVKKAKGQRHSGVSGCGLHGAMQTISLAKQCRALLADLSLSG